MDRFSRALLLFVLAVVGVVAIVVVLLPRTGAGPAPGRGAPEPEERPLGFLGAVGAPGPRCDPSGAADARAAVEKLAAEDALIPRALGVRRGGELVLVPEELVAPLRQGRLWEGVRFTNAVDVDVPVGFFVSAAPGDGALEALGLQQGDVVGAVSGWPLHDIQQVSRAWRALREEGEVCVEFFRERSWRRLWLVAERAE